MGILSIFGRGKGGQALTPLALAQRGKSPEHKEVLEFFYTVDTDKKGCLKKSGSKKGCGCMKSGCMTMDEYIARVNDYLTKSDLKARALAKLGLDESELEDVAPICLYDFVYNTNDESLLWKYEEVKVDKKKQKHEYTTPGTHYHVVTSKYSVTWIFFSKTQMYTYNFIFDMTSDNQVEYMKEFFLQDVTAFETESTVVERIERKVKAGCGCISAKEKFSKNNYTIDWFRVVVPGSQFSISMRNAGEQAESVMAAKALLRDRKFVK